MAWAGTQTTLQRGTKEMQLTALAFDADAEVSNSVDLWVGHRVNADLFTIAVSRTAGSEAVVSVFVQVSDDDTTWTSVIENTSSAGGKVANTAPIRGRYMRVLVTTVGVGNTLTVVVVATEDGL